MHIFARDLFPSQNPMSDNTASKTKQGVEQEHCSRAYQPIIGIPVPIQQTTQGPLMHADAVGAWAIERMGGRVFLIPLWPFPPHKHIYHSLWPLVQSMDGLLLPASTQGMHWSTHWQLRESRPGPQVWSLTWEMALMQLATFIGMPILAIADGAKKWNVALGGTIEEVPANASPPEPTTPENWERYTIRVRSQSRLASYLQPAIRAQEGEPEPWKLSFMPHQAIETVAPGVHPCGQSNATSITAFERTDATFGLGILGRLDWGLDQTYGRVLFEAFVQACHAFERARQQDRAWEAARDTICAAIDKQVTRNHPLLLAPQLHPQQRSQERHPPVPHNAAMHASAILASAPHDIARLQERFHLRPHPPTKEELNKIRRQRLKLASR